MQKTSLIDVNTLAISLVENHPGYESVAPIVDAGLAAQFRMLVPAPAVLRARWIMTTRWAVPKHEADAVLRAFLDQPRAVLVEADAATLRHAFELADDLKHDVYDTFLIALARRHAATSLITTDTGLKEPCRKAGIEYTNPVPPAILRRFVEANVDARRPGRDA